MIERYKYVNLQKQKLNETTFKIAAFYQSGMIVLVGGQIHLMSLTGKVSLSIETLKLLSISLALVVIAFSFFAAILLIGGLASWLKYRRDEAKIEKEACGNERPAPRKRDALRWYETYILLGIFGSALGYLSFTLIVVLPAL